jgi:hypothetical protein
MKIFILGLAILGSSLAFAGGGGGSRKPVQADIRSCERVSGNIESLVVYNTDAGMGSANQNTYVEIQLTQLELSYYFRLAKGINNSAQLLEGTHVEKNGGVYDPTHAIGTDSGISGETVTTIKLKNKAKKLYEVRSFIHVTRAFNDAVNGPDFQAFGILKCQ